MWKGFTIVGSALGIPWAGSPRLYRELAKQEPMNESGSRQCSSMVSAFKFLLEFLPCPPSMMDCDPEGKLK